MWCFLRTNESDVVIKHKVKVIFQKIQNLKVGRVFRSYVTGRRVDDAVDSLSLS